MRSHAGSAVLGQFNLRCRDGVLMLHSGNRNAQGSHSDQRTSPDRSGDGTAPMSLIREGEYMQFPKIRMITTLAFLFLVWNVWAQDKIDREVDVHKNVKLIVMAPSADLPEDVAKRFSVFLPIFEEALKESTADQSDDCALTIRVSAGVKEIGSAKTKRPLARIAAYRRNSRQEYLGNFILHSYITDGPVNKEETTQFLTKQILEPAVCRAAE
jgi:hypothetical protein